MTETTVTKPIGQIERELEDLYAVGHATGYGAGTTTHEAGCAGCLEARDLSHQWAAFWARFDAERLANP